MESMLEATLEQLETHRLEAGMRAIEETAQTLIGPLFAMFKEKRLYSKRDTLASRAWRENLDTDIDGELAQLITPNLVTFASCLMDRVVNGKAGEVDQLGHGTVLLDSHPIYRDRRHIAS